MREHFDPVPVETPDPNLAAMAKAAVFLDTDPDEAERIIEAHFEGAAWPVLTARELVSETDESLDWLVDGLLPAGGTSLLLGTSKSGKSTMARILAAKAAAGVSWYGRTTKAVSRPYIDISNLVTIRRAPTAGWRCKRPT